MLLKIVKYLLLLGIAFSPLNSTTSTAAEPSESAKRLTPHKALYDIRLLSKRSGTQITNVDGKMFYEWMQGCDAWETKHRFDLLYEYTDGPSMRITSDFSTFEAFDGSTLDFSSRRMRDGEVFEEIRGHADAPSQEKGLAAYTLPEKMAFPLPKGSMFPMSHTLKVIEQIQAGETIYSAAIFDGSDEQGPRQANAIIGKPVSPPKTMRENKNIDPTILNSPAHKLRLAYFILAEDDAEAEHEMDVVFHENGVISSMTIDYDEFSIAQKLIALEPVESSCKETHPAK